MRTASRYDGGGGNNKPKEQPGEPEPVLDLAALMAQALATMKPTQPTAPKVDKQLAGAMGQLVEALAKAMAPPPTPEPVNILSELVKRLGQQTPKPEPVPFVQAINNIATVFSGLLDRPHGGQGPRMLQQPQQPQGHYYQHNPRVQRLPVGPWSRDTGYYGQ